MSFLRRWTAVAVALVAIDLAIRAVFLPLVVRPHYAPGWAPLLRDRSGGRNLGILFQSVAGWFRRRGATVRVIIVGDSTVHGDGLHEAESVPYTLREALVTDLPYATPEVVDFSAIGMYARETLITVAEALKFKPDIVVCQLTLRGLIDDEWAGRATNVETFVGDAWISGTLPWPLLRERYSADSLLGDLVQTHWGLFLYRHEVIESIRAAAGFRRGPEQPPQPAGRSKDGVLLDRLYNFPNTNSKSVELMMDACGRTGGACFVYIGPFNPAVATDKVRGAVWHFRTIVRQAAQRAGVEFEDYWESVGPEYFRSRAGGTPDPIHYNTAGYKRVGRMLSRRVSRIIEEQRIAELARRQGWQPGARRGGGAQPGS